MSARQKHELSEPAAAQSVHVPLTIEERRQVVYSSLLRYGTEAVSLRERALDRAVLGALIGSSSDQPFRVGKIRENLHYRPDAPQIRQETVQESIVRLREAGKVEQVLLRKVNAYHLTATGAEEVIDVINSSEELFEPVIRNLLRDTAHMFPFDEGAHVFRRFLFECFGRFGQALARNITGHMTHESFLRAADLEATFTAATAGRRLSDEALESLKSRCLGFLRSSDPDGERLKFRLAQGYYFTQLLGFENGRFNPLNEHAFSGAVLYLDTNVLVSAVIPIDENRSLFDEIIRVAQRIGVEIKVTRATIEEARGVADNRLPLLQKIVDVIPGELTARTGDNLLRGFLQLRAENPGLTANQYMAPFERLSDIITEEMHLTIDERNAEEIIAGRDIDEIATAIFDAAVTAKGYRKPGEVVRHDAAHYLAVHDVRASGRKAWFLTRDVTLLGAAAQLDGDQPFFCFELIGFLHSVSPFLTTVEEQPFADVFADFIKERAFPAGNLFDTQELALMAEYHADVMATPPDQLVRAFDYIKSKVLEGRSYKRNDIPDVSLELKKFLASSKDEQMAALRAEAERRAAGEERLAKEKEEERQRREAEEAETAKLRGALTGKEEEAEATRTELAGVRQEMSEKEQRFAARQQRTRALVAAGGILAGVVVWIFNDAILAVLAQKVPPILAWGKYVTLALNAIGALVFSVPAFVFVKHMTLTTPRKVLVYTVISILALVFSHLVESSTVSLLSDYTGVGVFIATMAVAMFAVEKSG